MRSSYSEGAAADALDFSMRLPPSTGADGVDSHVRLHTSGLSLVYSHIIHDWVSWLATTFLGPKQRSSASNNDHDAGAPADHPVAESAAHIMSSCVEDGFFYRYSVLRQARHSLSQKVPLSQPVCLHLSITQD
jgi:hypothetical protein